MINVTQTFLPPLEEYVAQLQRIWDTKWLTNRGKLVRELETKLNELLGVENMLVVNNGTIALQVAIKVFDLTGEIITTPFSYVATVSSIVWEHCTPVFVDIDPHHLTIDETKIEAAISDKTQAILATHVYGNPCNVEAIARIAEKHRLKVIYDAAHCFGVRYKGASILNWGDISTLSFHATKLFHTGEGGAIVCNDKNLTQKIFYHHNFGHKTQEEFFGLGVNGKISELNAAMGLAVLPYIEEIVASRQKVCALYDSLLNWTDLRQPIIREGASRNFSYYPVIFPNQEKLLAAQKILLENEISARRYFYPSLNKLPYLNAECCSVSEEISSRILCLPLYAELEKDNIEKICGLINSILK
ncbi:MAG: DegT/DnrJ/EryC1/StrS family aminotransferase [Acidobacteriota bacterium]|nr:DegT/DnrJ/EryC1/StrS family aminotransferase [Acidobacteriota bacterium]